MRINHLWRPDRWAPVLLAIGPMLAELSREPARGLLGFRPLLGAGGPTVVQYWRSHDGAVPVAARGEGARQRLHGT